MLTATGWWSRRLPSWLDPVPSNRTAGALFPTACSLASRQELQISHPPRQGRRHGAKFSKLLFSLCAPFALVTVTLGCLCSRRAAYTHWHTQRRPHGIYKRRPQTQHTHKPSNTWWKSRVGPKSDGPARYSMKTTFSEPRLGEVRVPPGPLRCNLGV